jgi:uroporphyrinogen III methyltransferase/synthase
LVGSGPGDPKLITLRGVECLRRADVILYDYLVNSQILKHTRPDAEQICLGGHGGSRIIPQSEVNQQMIELARQGKTVVRLKGGDSIVFARLSEEAELLRRHEIPYEVVPGITAALAAGSYAGVPLTHRDIASAVALITGQEKSGKGNSTLDYEALARFPGTLVFYMGVTTARTWTTALLRAGKPPDTPVAIVRRCSFPDQTTVRCRLDEVVERLSEPTKMRPPAVIVVGPVASLSHAVTWFEQRALFGQCVLVTRPLEQCREMVDLLADLGAQVAIQPAIRISDPPDWDPVDRTLQHLDHYDWLVFSSANGVRYLLDRLLTTSGDLRSLGRVRLAAIGPGTSEALAAYHLRADLQPEEYRAEALAEALAAEADGTRFLLVRASRGREVLAERLRSAGREVEQVVVYSSGDVTEPDERIAQALAAGRMDWVTVTSSAIARSLVGLFGDRLRKAKLASISPLTSSALRTLGYEPAVEAQEYTISGVVSAIVDASAAGRE